MENLEKLVHNYFYNDYVQIRDLHALNMQNSQTSKDEITFEKCKSPKLEKLSSAISYENELNEFIAKSKISITDIAQFKKIDHAFAAVMLNLKFYSAVALDLINLDNKVNKSFDKLNKFIFNNKKSTEETINNTKKLLTELKQYNDNNFNKKALVQKVNEHINENINGYNAYENYQIKDNLIIFAACSFARNSINLKVQEIDNNFNKYCVKTR